MIKIKLKRIILAFATGASIISLAFASNMPRLFSTCIAVVGVLAIVYLIWSEIENDKINECVCKSNSEIKEKMKEIINNPSNTCIMSRDLSWVDDEVERCINNTARNILIFAEKSTELTKRLSEKGVKIMYYGKYEFVPKTRFTAIRYNKNDTQVAIANTENSIRSKDKIRHTIYQTVSSGDKKDAWINSLANDMISLCKKVCEEENKNNESKSDKTRESCSRMGQNC